MDFFIFFLFRIFKRKTKIIQNHFGKKSININYDQKSSLIKNCQQMILIKFI